jgi:hypothetical protein
MLMRDIISWRQWSSELGQVKLGGQMHRSWPGIVRLESTLSRQMKDE